MNTSEMIDLHAAVAKAISWKKRHFLPWSTDLDLAFALLSKKKWQLNSAENFVSYACTIFNQTDVSFDSVIGYGTTVQEAICRAVVAEFVAVQGSNE